MNIKRLSFSVLLPVAEITIWLALVPIQTGIIYYRFHQAAQGSQAVRIHTEHIDWTVPKDKWFSSAITAVATRNSETIVAINLPGLIVEILISIPTSWPSTWQPAGILLPVWRSLIFPIYSLPAWWFVGRGLDGLLGRRRVFRIMLITGSIAVLLLLIFLFGFFFSASQSERTDLYWLLPGVVFWTFAFGLFPLTWVKQRVTDRQIVADDRNL